MDKHSVYTMTMEEYDELLDDMTDGILGIRNESGEWFYVSTDECGYEDDEIIDLLSEKLGEEVLDVIVDFQESKVAIVCM